VAGKASVFTGKLDATASPAEALRSASTGQKDCAERDVEEVVCANTIRSAGIA
jgi:hypothetical protein